MDSPGSDAVLPIYVPDSETILGSDNGGLVIKSNIGEMPVLTPVVGTTELNDFGGTVRVNLSATDFAGLLRSGGFEKIDSPENITILDSAPEANSVGPYLAIDPDSIPEFDGLNQLGNINTFDSAHDTPGTNDSTFYWNTSGNLEFTAIKALSLPEMGVAPQGGNSPILTDAADQLEIVLPQLSMGQLASFETIVVSDDKTLSLDAATFQRLDSAVQTLSWSSHRGTEVVDSNGNQSKLEVTGSIDELINNGIISASGIRNQEIEGNQAVNLLSRAEIVVNSLEGLQVGEEIQIVQTLLSQPNLSFDTGSASLGTIEMGADEFLSLATSAKDLDLPST